MDAIQGRLEHDNRAGAECLAAALEYQSRGWSPLCLCPPDHLGVGREHGKNCDHPGKRPLPDFGRWKAFQEAPAGRQTVEGWWKYHPNANVGLALGPVSGLVGVDVEGDSAEARLLDMSAGDLPTTLEFRTGKGRRLLYAIPPGANLRPTYEDVGQRSEEVRFLGKGSQTVMPPSRHPSGSRYAWAPGRGPGEIDPAPAPGWLVKVMAERADRARAEPLGEGEPIPQGNRDTTLTSLAGTMRARGFSGDAILAALKVENEARCAPPLEDAQVAKIARSVARYEPDAYAGVTLKFPPPSAEAAVAAVRLEEIRREQERVESWPHDDLLAASFPEQSWLVEGLVVSEGLTLIGGKKKLGKSWLCLQIAQAVALGASVLGRHCPHPGLVFYLCLEDGARRLQDRLRKQKSPRGLEVRWYTRFPRLDGEGMADLLRLAEESPRLIIIDTLAAAKSGRLDENAAGPMADLSNSLRQLAQHFRTGVITVVHHGKVSYGDPGDDIRGSSALAAAADVNIGLYKSETGFSLRGEGRDISAFSEQVHFDAHESWKWLPAAEAEGVPLPPRLEDGTILFVLRRDGEQDINSIAQTLQRDRTSLLRRLNALVREQAVLRRDDHGRFLYRAAPPPGEEEQCPF